MTTQNSSTIEILSSLPFKMMFLQFAIEPVEEMTLSSYPATTIRGGLGYALKQKMCLFDMKTCRDRCQSTKQCSYMATFEEQEGVQTEAHQYIPYTRPYIIRTKTNHQLHFQKNEQFQFELILFGDATDDYMSYIGAMKRFGEKGIGKKRDLFFIRSVKSIEPTIDKIIYEDNQLLSEPKIQSLSEYSFAFNESLPTKLKLEFLTPVRMKHEGRYVQNISFELLIMNLVRRLGSLLYFHHQCELDTELEDIWFDAAIDVVTVSSRWHQDNIERYSTRQHQKMKLNGMVGEMTIEGETLKHLLPLLQVGQVLHIGKQSAFGFGQYKLSIY